MDGCEGGLDAEVAEFRDRTLAAQDFPYVFLDATYCKARVGHRIVGVKLVMSDAHTGLKLVMSDAHTG